MTTYSSWDVWYCWRSQRLDQQSCPVCFHVADRSALSMGGPIIIWTFWPGTIVGNMCGECCALCTLNISFCRITHHHHVLYRRYFFVPTQFFAPFRWQSKSSPVARILLRFCINFWYWWTCSRPEYSWNTDHWGVNIAEILITGGLI